MIENHDGLKIEKNVKAHFARSSIRRLKKNVVSRRGSPFSPKKYSRNLIHVLARLFLIQVFLQYTEVIGHPLLPHRYRLQWLEDSDVANPELEPHNQLSSSFSYLPFQPTLTFDHPLQSGYTKNGYEANSQALLTGFSKEDDISPKSYALVSSSSDNPSVSNGPKKDKKEGKKEQELQDPKMVHFTGRLTGEIDLKDVEKLQVKSEAKDAKLRTRRSFFHTRLNKSQLKHLLRSALPTKRILFNEIVLNHAPDLRKNETGLDDLRSSTPSPSDKASRYFIDLQHLRKKFWERYRHLLIPMIRKQAQKSGIKRIATTATSLGLRQTKKRSSDSENFSDFRRPPFALENQLQNPKRNPMARFMSSSSDNFGEDERAAYLPPMASWKTRTFKPPAYQVSKKWQMGSNIKKWDETQSEDGPNRNFQMERWQRFGRSLGKPKDNRGVANSISKRGSTAPNKSKDDISMMHYLAYSLLYDRRHRRSSKLEEIPVLTSMVGEENNELVPETVEAATLPSKESNGQNEDEDMEGMYLQLLNEILKEKALTNRRTNQSKLRLL